MSFWQSNRMLSAFTHSGLTVVCLDLRDVPGQADVRSVACGAITEAREGRGELLAGQLRAQPDGNRNGYSGYSSE